MSGLCSSYLSVAFSFQLLGKALRIICILEGKHAVPDLVGAHQALAIWPCAASQQLHGNTMVIHMPVTAGLWGSDSVRAVLIAGIVQICSWRI